MSWNQDNTEGYSHWQLAEINEEWALIVERDGLEIHTDEYNEAHDAFADAVARR